MTKRVYFYCRTVLTALLLILSISCEKKETHTIPVLSTLPVTNISDTIATSGGIVTSDGGTEIVAFGVCWSTVVNPLVTDSRTVDGTGIGQFESSLTNLKAGTIYHVRAYATNSVGVAYGNDISFSTPGQTPECITLSAINISYERATLTGSVNPNLLSTIVTFEYGTSLNYDQSVTSAQSPAAGDISLNVSADITGLFSSTLYHFRIKTVNSLGTVYGEDMTFVTSAGGGAPVCVTKPATNLSTDKTTLNGIVTANHASTTVTFEYGMTTSYGNIATATQSPVTGNSETNVSIDVSGFTQGSTYHFRIKATNSAGTTYGEDVAFLVLYGTVTDIDLNVYRTVLIGTQIWMAENLKTTRYNDGTPIQLVMDDNLWHNLSVPAYCWYNNDEMTFKDTYGALYFLDINTYPDPNPFKNPSEVCPVGWRLPFLADLDNLNSLYGGTSETGGNLKETGTSHWVDPNVGATNESGFTALPGGYRDIYGAFLGVGFFGTWLTTERNTPMSFYRKFSVENKTSEFSYSGYGIGESVRCLKSLNNR
jgi:uncharacterized protein (TIGR02145 family)